MPGTVKGMETPRRDARPKARSSARKGRSGWNNLFIAAVAAVALSFVVLVFVVADKFDGGGSNTLAAAPTEQQSGDENSGAAKPTSRASVPVNPSPTAAPTGPPGQDGDTSPLVACGDLLAPLDKQHRLPANCVPSGLTALPAAMSAQGSQQLTSQTAAAMTQMFDAARKAGFELVVNSGYRSYQTQVETYNYWVQLDGQEYADRTSARAGHSEHQLGTVADVGAARGLYLEDFSGTPEATWLGQNSWKYGFIISYPDGKESVTGYVPEPWHVRYVGVDTAAKVQNSGLTLHEYLLK